MRKLAYIPTYLALALIMGGCAGVLDRAPKLNEIVLNDVQQAGFMAARTGDTLASLCWDYLEDKVAATVPESDTPQGTVVGVLSAYQKARNVRRVVEVEVTLEFKLACGPMLLDSAGALGRLGIRIL